MSFAPGHMRNIRALKIGRCVLVHAGRRVPDYSSRRAGGQDENRRRSGGGLGARAPPARRQSTDFDAPGNNGSVGYGAGSLGSSYNSAPARRSVDYASRRAGGEEENRRRGSNGRRAGGAQSSGYGGQSDDYSHQSSSGYQPPAQGNARPNPQVQRRRSVDYSSRRSGGQEENQRRSRDYRPSVDISSRSSAPQDTRPQSQDWTPMSTGYGPPVSPQVQRRRSVDYASRRSGGEEENLRRSRDYQTPRGGGRAPPRRRSVDVLPRGPVAEGPPSRQGRPERRISSDKVTGRNRRRTGDVDLSRQSVLELDADRQYDTVAEPDWVRIIANNIPAVLGLVVAVFAINSVTDFALARFILRYGGPGAPVGSVAIFWLLSIISLGGVSALITAVAFPGSFVLEGECPECGELNQGKFDDVFGIRDSDTVSRTECKECMADLEFDLETRTVIIVGTSQQKKSAALERGRREALAEAKREAEAVMSARDRGRNSDRW